MDARVVTDKDDALRAVQAALTAVAPASLSRSLRAGAQVYQRGMQRRAPHGHGTLAGSIRITQTSATEVVVGTGLVYAAITEYGGTIRPKGKFLKFQGQGGPKYMRGLRIRSQPYFEPTFAADSEAAFEAFADEFERILRRR